MISRNRSGAIIPSGRLDHRKCRESTAARPMTGPCAVLGGPIAGPRGARRPSRLGLCLRASVLAEQLSASLGEAVDAESADSDRVTVRVVSRTVAQVSARADGRFDVELPPAGGALVNLHDVDELAALLRTRIGA
jgi:hypothetical protein